MKKYCLLFLLMWMLLLAACQPTDNSILSIPSSDFPSSDAPIVELLPPTAAELSRPETTTLTFLVEGMTEELPATLHIGDGYSLYIPNEGWDGVQTDLWQASANADVVLEIGTLQGIIDRSDAEILLMQDFGSTYGLETSADGSFLGMSGDRIISFRLLGATNGNYLYLIQQYPQEAAEGFGARLSVIAETIQLITE